MGSSHSKDISGQVTLLLLQFSQFLIFVVQLTAQNSETGMFEQGNLPGLKGNATFS